MARCPACSKANTAGRFISTRRSARSNAALRSAEEGTQLRDGLGGVLLGKEMTPGDGAPSDRDGPIAPNAQRSSGVLVPLVETTSRAPQHEHRACDAVTPAAILRVPRKVDRGGRAILLADGMHRVGIAQRLDIGRANVRRKARRVRAPSPKRVVHDDLRI